MNAVFEDKSPAIRFKEFENSWTFKSLNCFASKVSKKNIELDEHRVLTNSARDGIVLQQHFFDKEIGKLENLTGYYKVEINDFVYNPRISKYASAGPVNRNKLTEGVVSPLYTVFRFFTGNLDFLEQYLKSTKWHRHIKKIANYGARFDRMNITNSDFFTLPIPLIEELEQQKIASFLSSIDRRIEQLDRKKLLLEEYRKGMMQKLFSREIRFRDERGHEYPEWEEIILSEVVTIKKGQQLNRDEMIHDGNFPVINGGVAASGYTATSNFNGGVTTVSEGGNSCGYVAWQSNDFWLGGHCYALLPCSQSLVPVYLYYFLKSIQDRIMRLRVGSGLPNIQKRDLSKLTVYVSSSEEQQKIASFLSSIDRKIELVSVQIKKSREFKRGLLQQMFV